MFHEDTVNIAVNLISADAATTADSHLEVIVVANGIVPILPLEAMKKTDDEDLDDFFNQISALSIIDSKEDTNAVGRIVSEEPPLVKESTVVISKTKPEEQEREQLISSCSQQKKTSIQPKNWNLISTANETQINWQTFQQATSISAQSPPITANESKKISFGIKKKKGLKVPEEKLANPVSIPIIEVNKKNSAEHVMLAILDTNVLITPIEFAAAKNLLKEIPGNREISSVNFCIDVILF